MSLKEVIRQVSRVESLKAIRYQKSVGLNTLLCQILNSDRGRIPHLKPSVPRAEVTGQDLKRAKKKLLVVISPGSRSGIPYRTNQRPSFVFEMRLSPERTPDMP
jgi:hypothetical protein